AYHTSTALAWNTRGHSPRPEVAPFFFSSRGRHTIFSRDWSSDVCSSDLGGTRTPSPGRWRRRPWRRRRSPCPPAWGRTGRGQRRRKRRRPSNRCRRRPQRSSPRLPRRAAVDAVVPAEVAAGGLPSVAPADVAGALGVASGPNFPTGGHEPGGDVLPGGLLAAVAPDGDTDPT